MNNEIVVEAAAEIYLMAEKRFWLAGGIALISLLLVFTHSLWWIILSLFMAFYAGVNFGITSLMAAYLLPIVEIEMKKAGKKP